MPPPGHHGGMPGELFDILVRGIAVGLLVAVGAGMARAPAPVAQRAAGLFFCIAIIGYIVQEPDALPALFGAFNWPLRFLAVIGTGALWLFVLMLFADPPKLRPWHALPFGGLLALALVGMFAPDAWRWSAWLVHNAAEAALVLHAVAVILRGRQGDLIEERRDLRVGFLIAIAVFAFAIAVIEGLDLFIALPAFLDRINGVALALAAFAGAVLLLQTRSLLFAPPWPGRAASEGTVSSAGGANPDQAALDRILALADQQQIWRREGLTIGMLAAEAGLPEHRARRLINTQLGCRNFSEFVNARRIEAAKQALADPARLRTTVAGIAYELGFGSLGPFNRAFKEATGQTPTVWRRATFAAAGRNPESLVDSENAKDS